MSKVRMVINDPSGEFWQAHGDPEKDIYFNPTLLGTVNWSIFKDLKYDYDPALFAQALLPKREAKGGNGDFFDPAAREVFSGVLLRLAEAGSINTSDIPRAFLELDEEEMDKMTQGLTANLSVSLDAKQMRAGVLASIAIHLNGLAMVSCGHWSCSDWLDGGGDLYLIGNESALSGLKRLFLTSLIELIASRLERVKDIKYLFLLDEWPMVGDINVEKALEAYRKYGIGMVLGMQSESQAETIMGKDRAQTAFNLIGTMLVLNQNTHAAQKSAEERFGRQLQLVVGESHQLAVSDSKDSISVNTTQQERPLVMSGEFGTLDTGKGFLKVIGSFPAARVDFSTWGKSPKGQKSKIDRITEIKNQLPDRDPRFLITSHLRAEDWAIKLRRLAAQARLEELSQGLPDDPQLRQAAVNEINQLKQELQELPPEQIETQRAADFQAGQAGLDDYPDDSVPL